MLKNAAIQAIRTAIRNPKGTYLALVRIGFALGMAFLVCQFPFDYIEALFYDARVRLKPVSATSGHVELVAIDSETVERLSRVPNATDHAQLVRRLKAGGAKSIVYLVSPNEIVGSLEELGELAREAASAEHFYVAVPDTALKGEEDAFKLLPPFEKLVPLSAPNPRDRNIFAGDNVTRRMFISYQDQLALHPIVASMFNSEMTDANRVRGAFEYLQSKQTYIDFRPTRTYPFSSFVKVIGAPEADLERFRGKVVFVGRDIQTTAKDYILTPFSRSIVAMTVLEMNANMLDTLILNSAPTRTPYWFDLLVTSLISILTVYVVLAVKPTRGLVTLATTIGVFFLLSFLAFWWGRVWVDMAHPFLSIFICYYFFIPYRLIIENRRSWEYLQKNRLLTQVEELKTNFLSMMSHDLKTPIARIQGMTDVVLNDANELSPIQKEALGVMAKSSQELLDFVSSILNLGRIESKEIKLHLVSRDPNGLLKEVIDKSGYMAKAKGIEVVTELEPLFSVKMDVDLMRQVFTNLIENAIKYSPENTRILVTSMEDSGRVVIEVADQGIGIPDDELPHVFTKFYRSKTVKSSSTKGSGLGLYLAKYFVELHKGTISVDSQLGEGSTFTVELPTETQAESAAV